MENSLKRSTFVDAIGWILTAFGVLGIAVTAIQLFVSLAGLAAGTAGATPLALSVIGIGYSALVLWIGGGLRRRRPWARLALMALLAICLLWNSYWLAALALRLPLSPFSEELVAESAFRTPMIAVCLIGAALYVWVLLKFKQPSIEAEFQPRDV